MTNDIDGLKFKIFELELEKKELEFKNKNLLIKLSEQCLCGNCKKITTWYCECFLKEQRKQICDEFKKDFCDECETIKCGNCFFEQVLKKIRNTDEGELK